MFELLLSPQGRINSAEFYRAGHMLVLISIGLGLLHFVNPGIAQVLAIFSILLTYSWVAIWIKRLHYGGKSGWMFLVYILLFMCVSMVAISIMLVFVGGEEIMQIWLDTVSEKISEAEMQTKMEAWQLANMLPIIITKSVSSILTLYIGDKTIPS